MDLKLLKKTKDSATFNIKGLPAGYLNSIRRQTISTVPVMAIEDVAIHENTSILHDEVLAHRLGLLPLQTDLKTYKFIDECSCKGEGCGNCTAKLTLDVAGPAVVTAKDVASSSPKVKPVYPESLLVKLTEKHKVKLEMTAQLGFGTEHMKWQAGLCYYALKEDGSADLTFESYGQIPLDEMIKQAFESMTSRLQQVKKEVSKKGKK